ncbi:MAG: hypothetical protein U1C52_01845, partial [Patescibacteria group bacterium]|nr:hypothetical protein [Patescibacteria group bacterium]
TLRQARKEVVSARSEDINLQLLGSQRLIDPSACQGFKSCFVSVPGFSSPHEAIVGTLGTNKCVFSCGRKTRRDKRVGPGGSRDAF